MSTVAGSSSGILPQKVKPSDTTPLLSGTLPPASSVTNVPVLSHGEECHHHGVDGGSQASAVFNLSNTIIGAGIMGLPATLKVRYNA